MTNKFSVACLQMNSSDDLAENLEFVDQQLQIAKKHDVKVVLLPENFAHISKDASSMYVEEDNNGPVQNFLSTKSKQYSIDLIAGSVPISNIDTTSNSESHEFERAFARSMFYHKGSRVGRYDKIHLYDVVLPSGESYFESKTYIPGDISKANFEIVKSDFGAFGLSICYDLRFPEMYRTLVEHGANILCVPAAFTFQTGQAHWQQLLQTRAIENQCYVLASAQVGLHANSRETWGHSMIIDPWGEVLAINESEIGLVIADIDLHKQQELRKSFPVLKHQRLK